MTQIQTEKADALLHASALAEALAYPCRRSATLPDCFGVLGGGEEGDRTLDLRIANAALSQLSYFPTRGAKYIKYWPKRQHPRRLRPGSTPPGRISRPRPGCAPAGDRRRRETGRNWRYCSRPRCRQFSLCEPACRPRSRWLSLYARRTLSDRIVPCRYAGPIASP